MLKIKALLIVSLMLSVAALNYNDCGSEYDIEDFAIEGCNYSPCQLKKYTNRTMGITMYSRHRTHELDQQLKVNLKGLNVNLKVTPDDPCKQIKCPVTAQNREHLNVTIDLSSFMLFESEGTMQWKVLDKSDKKVLLCIETLVKIFP